MFRGLLLCAVLTSCDSARSRDCQRVHAALAHVTLGGSGVTLRDEREFAKLRALKLDDPEVASAVKAMIDETGWTMYAPLSAAPAPESGTARLARLCK